MWQARKMTGWIAAIEQLDPHTDTSDITTKGDVLAALREILTDKLKLPGPPFEAAKPKTEIPNYD